jgi:hypothetical protein
MKPSLVRQTFSNTRQKKTPCGGHPFTYEYLMRGGVGTLGFISLD